jgi:hypothetical protein
MKIEGLGDLADGVSLADEPLCQFCLLGVQLPRTSEADSSLPGRADKTIHILTSIDDEAKRRRTLIQLNRGEDRHSLARVVFHGKRGELRQHYREGQEDQLGALGLVVNVIVLWNTIYMDAVIEQLRSEEYPLKPEDVGRLARLMFEHINFLGRYAFALPDPIAQDQLWPLRSAEETDNE